MAKKGKHLFELDRKMELKVRLAVKNAKRAHKPSVLRRLDVPERETVDKLIARVRSL